MRFGRSQHLPRMVWHTKSYPDRLRYDRVKGLGPSHQAREALQMGFQKWTFLSPEATVLIIEHWSLDMLLSNALPQSHITHTFWFTPYFGHNKGQKSRMLGHFTKNYCIAAHDLPHFCFGYQAFSQLLLGIVSWHPQWVTVFSGEPSSFGWRRFCLPHLPAWDQKGFVGRRSGRRVVVSWPRCRPNTCLVGRRWSAKFLRWIRFVCTAIKIWSFSSI